ncbi:MAG TPA: hypothetical protein VHI13_01070 [Candidatus Kapabacteria bacterium]|nr:hypothetical protein [Candidatus Kapabacteria bacterium]
MRVSKLPVAILFTTIAIAITAAGCSKRIGDFTMVTTKNYERSTQYKMVGRMEGSDKAMMILFIPTGSPDIKNAVDRAIEAGNGVYLANAVLESTQWYALLVGQFGYTVTGDVYAPVSHGDLENPAIEKFQLMGKGGDLAMVSTSTDKRISVQDVSSLLAK